MQYIVNIDREVEELPSLPALKRNFKDALFRTVSKRLNSRIENRDTFALDRKDAVLTVVDLLPTLPAMDRGAKPRISGIPYSCTVVKTGDTMAWFAGISGSVLRRLQSIRQKRPEPFPQSNN